MQFVFIFYNVHTHTILTCFEPSYQLHCIAGIAVELLIFFRGAYCNAFDLITCFECNFDLTC